MGANSFDALAYARSICNALVAIAGLQLTVGALGGGKPYFYGTLHKHVLEMGRERLVTSGDLFLNVQRLSTPNRVRWGLAHELAHLVPGQDPFRARWKMWKQVVDEVAKTLEEKT